MEGLITPVQDRPKEPVYLFTQANVIHGLFDYEYTGAKARTNCVSVTWNDPNQQYKQDTITVDDQENILKVGKVIEKKVVAFGATSEGQAKRVANWHLATDLLETEVVKFKSSINIAHLRIGDIIGIQDQELSERIIASGKIVDSNGKFFKFDRAIDISSLKSAISDIVLHVIVPEAGVYLAQESATINGVTYRRGDLIATDKDGNKFQDIEQNQLEILNNIVDDSLNLVSAQLETRGRVEKRVAQFDQNLEKVEEVFISTPILLSDTNSQNPDFYKEKIFALTSAKAVVEDTVLKKYRILGLSQDSDTEFGVTAGAYVEEKFDEIDKDFSTYQDPQYDEIAVDAEISSVIDAFVDLEPDFATFEGTPASVGGYDLVIDWEAPTQTVINHLGDTIVIPNTLIGGYIVQHNAGRSNNIETITVTGVNNTIVKIPNVAEGTYTITIKAFSVGDQSKLSAPFTFTRTVKAPVGSDKEGRLGKGGSINKALDFNKDTGILNILSPESYEFTSTSQEVFIAPATANTSSSQVSFASMSNSSSAFWMFDRAGSRLSTPAPWKVVLAHTDSTATTGRTTEVYDYIYFKTLGASNNGLSVLTTDSALTISSVEIGVDNKVNVEFTTDHGMATGDSIAIASIGSGSTVELNSNTYFVVVESRTRVFLQDSVGTFTNGGGFTPYSTSVARGTGTRSSTITIKAEKDSTLLVGTNTSFVTDFEQGDLLKVSTSSTIGTEIATSEYKTVVEVLDNHRLIVDTKFTRTYGATGSLITVDTISGADTNRVAGTYLDVPATSNNSEAIVGTFKVVIAANGSITSITPMVLGSKHVVNDTLTIQDTDVGGTGAAVNITFDVATISDSGSIFKSALRANATNDCLLAQVDKNSDGSEYTIKYFSTHESLDSASGETVTEFDAVRALPTHIVDDSSDNGELAQISMPNTKGVTSTAAASAIVRGNLGHRGTAVNLDSITSSKVAVFETTSAHGLTDMQMVEINGIATQYPMNALNGTTGKVVTGSGSLVTGSNPTSDGRMLILTTGAYSGTNHGSQTVDVINAIPDGGVDEGTATVSVSNGALSIASIDTGGAGYTKSSGGSFVQIVVGSNTYLVLLNAAGVVSNDYTTKFRLVGNTYVHGSTWSNAGVLHIEETEAYVDTSSYTALTADTGTVTHINPATFELSIEGTFPENTKTLPNAYITATGRIVADPGLALLNQYIDVEGGSLLASELKANYNLNPGATFKQASGGSQVFCGTIYSVVTLSTTKIRVIFLDVQGYLFYDLSGPAINIGSSLQATYNGHPSNIFGFGSSDESLAAAEVQADGAASDIAFSNVTPSSTSGSGDITGGDSLQCSFTVKPNGKVVSATVNSSRQGTGFKDLDTITFTDGDLNGVNSNYGSSRGDVTFSVDINGTINTSVDGASTYGGTGEIIVDSVSNVIGQNIVELDGRVTTKTSSSYVSKVKGYLSVPAGFEIASTSNLGTSSAIEIAGNTSNISHFLSNDNELKIEGITGIAEDSVFKAVIPGTNGSFTVELHDSNDADVVGTGLSHTDGGNPGASGFVRGTNGFVIGPGATKIDSVVLDGTLIV